MSTEQVSDSLKRDLFAMLCGNMLGMGAARVVFEHAFDPSVVIKFEGDGGSFQNVIEWETWQRVKDTDLAHWFAPCVAISPNGSVLVQRRTRPAVVYPEKVPTFFADLKLANFGTLMPEGKEDGSLFNGRFVCHDYGMHLMLEKGMTKRMQKANWWSL